MTDLNTPLGHHLFEIAVAHAVAAGPPHRPQDDFTRELPTGEDAHGPDYSTPVFLLPQLCNSTDLIDYATFLMDEWEIPEEVLLLAASEDGMHQCFVINYGLPDFPEGAVLYVDTDPDGIIMPVAESVDAFLSKLGPYPDQEETVEDAEPDNIGINGVRYGSLSEPLRKAISATPTPGIEKLLKQATELITKDLNPIITENSPESRTFYDVVYWIVQHIEPQHDPETFANGGREGQILTFPELMKNSFIVPGQKYELGYTLASLIMWWDRRVKEGVLKETDNGFILDENYAGSVFDRLRQGEIQN